MSYADVRHFYEEPDYPPTKRGRSGPKCPGCGRFLPAHPTGEEMRPAKVELQSYTYRDEEPYLAPTVVECGNVSVWYCANGKCQRNYSLAKICGGRDGW